MNEQQSTNTPVLNDAVPAPRFEELVITESGDEVLVYDKQRHQIHHLNHTSAVIWRLCDGRRNVDEIARLARVELAADELNGDAVRLALVKLGEAELLQSSTIPSFQMSAQSRRKLMKRLAMAGAGAAIVSITAPMAVAAASCTGSEAPCNSGHVNQNCCLNGVIGVCTQTQVGPPAVYACIVVG